MSQPDYMNLARQTGREGFLSMCPYVFLVSADPVELPRPTRPTLVVDTSVLAASEDGTGVMRRLPELLVPSFLVLAIHKIQPAFRDMITIGRTPNHDLVINDITVSKFHAFFRATPVADRFTLEDARSRNGTFVGDRQLVPGVGIDVGPGVRLRFGAIGFDIVDGRTLWDRAQTGG